MIAALVFAVTALQAMPAAPAPACTAIAPPPAGLEAWSAKPVARPLGPGVATALTLSPATGVTFALPPEHAPAPDSFATVAPLSIAVAGTYRIALGAGAWIDLVHDGKAVPSVAHTHGPDCSGIRKIVDFTLTPGTYQLQLSGAKAATLTVLVAPRG